MLQGCTGWRTALVDVPVIGNRFFAYESRFCLSHGVSIEKITNSCISFTCRWDRLREKIAWPSTCYDFFTST